MSFEQLQFIKSCNNSPARNKNDVEFVFSSQAIIIICVVRRERRENDLFRVTFLSW